MANYCLNTKNFSFFLCGKIQTDKLEERFGKYRQLAGSQYHISIRQVFESENKLRLQSMVPLVLKSHTYGDFSITPEEMSSKSTECDVEDFRHYEVSPILKEHCACIEEDLDDIEHNIWPILTYIAGYAAYATNKRIKCNYCRVFLTEEDVHTFANVIAANDRGGLCYPSQDLVQISACVYTIVTKCLENEQTFLSQPNQKHAVMMLSASSLEHFSVFSGLSCEVHGKDLLVKSVVSCLSNILLKNYAKRQNDNTPKKTVTECKRQKF